jgi:transcriptional regulator GlxA family with amidase domain
MRVAVLLYPNVSLMDFAGPVAVLSRVPGVDFTYVAEEAGRVRSDSGRGVVADCDFSTAASADIVLVPGSSRPGAALSNATLLAWLRRAHEAATWTVSVCTGSLLLASAGLLAGRRATSHWFARDKLAAYGALPVDERVVVDAPFITAGGVSAGLDLGLTLVERCFGEASRLAATRAVNYAPDPPFRAGTPASARRSTRLWVGLAFALQNPLLLARLLHRARAATTSPRIAHPDLAPAETYPNPGIRTP